MQKPEKTSMDVINGQQTVKNGLLKLQAYIHL